MNKKVVIFDFDGVIIDSLGVVVSVSQKLSRLSFSKNDRELSKKDSSYFRSLSSDQLYFKMPKWKILLLVLYVRIKLKSVIENIQPVNGMREELEKMKSKGYTMGILSSNSRGNIEKFLAKNNLNYFDFIYSGSVFLKKDKKLRKVIEKHNFFNKQIIFVGDETRDIEAAKKNNAKIIAVSWGYTSRDVLGKFSPDYIIDKPEELAFLISKI